jgi:serine/threonine-protein kinase HipA
MARQRNRIPLNVYLNGRLTGQLRREASGAIDFQYDPAWLEWEHTFPISLSLPLREDHYVGDPVIAVFDNLLPDNEDMRRRVAAKTQASGTDAYSLLAAIGRDCVGALEFLPEGIDPGQVGTVNSDILTDTRIAEILAALEGAPLGLGDDAEFRISLAGVQEKTALLNLNDTWHVPHGSTATTHIIKPQIGRRGDVDLTQSVENEFFCMQILIALGLPTAPTEIADFDDQRALIIERFDRRWTRDGRLIRLPQEDCCQALSVPSLRKYQSNGGPGIMDILEFLKGSDDPAEDQALFMESQIAFWLMAATDGHAKNFSVFLYPGGGFRLTPLYDVMSTQPLFDAGQLRRNQMRHAMSVGDSHHYRVHDIMPRHFQQSAERVGMPSNVVMEIMDQLCTKMPLAIEIVCESLPSGFPAQLRDSITEGIKGRIRRLATVTE